MRCRTQAGVGTPSQHESWITDFLPLWVWWFTSVLTWFNLIHKCRMWHQHFVLIVNQRRCSTQWPGIVLLKLLKHLCSSTALESFPAVASLQQLHWSEVACLAVPRGFPALQLKFCRLWVYSRLRCMAQLTLAELHWKPLSILKLCVLWIAIYLWIQHVHGKLKEILVWSLSPMEPLPLVWPCCRLWSQLSGRSNFGDAVGRGFNMKLSTDQIFKKMLGLIRYDQHGTCREDQSPDWWPVSNSGTFFLHLASMVYSTILYKFHSSYFMCSFTTYSWAKAIWLGPFVSRGKERKTVGITCVIICSMLFTSRLTTSPRNLLEQQVQMAMKSDSSREVYDDIMIAAHGILLVWQTTRNVGAREVQSSSKLVIQCYSKYVQMRFSMIQHDSCKKIVGIRWNPPNAHRVGSGVGAYRRILEGIDPPRLMQAREEMLCLAFGVARWISENVWDGLWWFIYNIYI